MYKNVYYVSMSVIYILYSGKFSRGPIFMVFADDHLIIKIKPTEISLIVQCIIGVSGHVKPANGRPTIYENFPLYGMPRG